MFKLNALVLTMAALVSTSALASNSYKEVESNDAYDQPNPSDKVVVPGGVGEQAIIHAYFGDNSNLDVDFYTFYAKAGEVVTIDIDNGFKGTLDQYGIAKTSDPGSVDLTMTLFKPDGTIDRFCTDVQSAPYDPEGSIGVYDPYLPDVKLEETGLYTIGVVNSKRIFSTDGQVGPAFGVRGTGASSMKGEYDLIITRVKPLEKIVNIDIRPGSQEQIMLNPNSKAAIPVAILGSEDFNVANIDEKSLRFGLTCEEESLLNCDYTYANVNKDSHVDKVCRFKNDRTGFKSGPGGSVEGCLQGVTKDGETFKGRAFLKVKVFAKDAE